MDHLRNKYLEEAKDLLQELEQALLLLEETPDDKNTADTIFRVMHTLKGSSSMFGYQKVGELTHLLENCFDNIREGRAMVGNELLTLVFSSLDHIRHLLEDPELTDKKAAKRHYNLLKQAIELYDETIQPGEGSFFEEEKKEERTLFIHFEPRKEILKNGSNPLFLLDDLGQLGTMQTFVRENNLPSLSDIDPQLCYLSWGCLLATSASLSEIREIFMFVDHLCDLEIAELTIGNAVSGLSKEKLQNISASFSGGINFNFPRFTEEFKIAILGGPLPEPAQQEQPLLKDSGKEATVSSIRVASDKLDDLMNLVSELVATQARLSLLAEKDLSPELIEVAEEIEKITRRLRDNIFDICLIPIGSNLTRFKRLVRDLSKELNKKILFEAEGIETELDKNVMEHLTDCLIHIFRNSIDHGIEEETERIKKGKNPEGKILLKAYNSGAYVVIEIKDDGAGIDPAKIKAKALQKGLISQEQLLTDKEAFDLVFHPGFSTAAKVTEVSGRGVGMDVVRKKIKDLRGEVSIESVFGEGTTIRLAIPLTISIIDGLLVRVDNTDFVLPLSFVEKSYAVNPQDMEKAINNQLILNGEPVPFFDLSSAFADKPLEGHGFAIQIRTGNKKMALVVEEIVGEYQAVLKPLGQFYRDIDFISGASLKGDGTVVLVIDPQKLIEDLSKNKTEV